MTLALQAQHVQDAECRLNWDQIAALLPNTTAALDTRYAQLAVATARKLDFGTVVLTWPGGGSAATPLIVNHNLGAAPVVVVYSNDSGPGVNAPQQYWTTAKSSTQFTINGWGSGTGAGTTPVAWLAVG